MLVSVVKPNSLSPDGEYIQKSGKEKKGTILYQIELKEILEACDKGEKFSGKHQNGAIFPYISSTLGISDDSHTDGVIFVDIDNITRDIADTIFNNFEKLCEKFPCLYAIQYSSSYYLNENKTGLHIYVCSYPLDYDEYNYLASLSLYTIARIILTELGIDLRKPMIDDNEILDDHNTKIGQRFFLYHSPYKINEYCDILVEEMFSKETKSNLKKEYHSVIINKTVHVKQKVTLDCIDGNIKKNKLLIDKHFYIGKWNGNDIRWRISRIAQSLFGENAKSWCDKYFYCENGKSIYTHQNDDKNISYIIKNWLEKEGYLESKTENLIKRGEYIIKYKDKILEFIKNNKRCEIIAPTGGGKTTMINGVKGYIYDMFNNDKDSMFSLAYELNAIVIVPFNVTNNLYDNMIEVSSDTHYEVKPDKPCVMIWDQALIHWEKIKNRTLIIDEAHCLFLDRQYRDVAIKLMVKIKEDDCKIVLFTATPAGEGKELDCKTLKFTSQRDPIQTQFIKVNHVDVAQYNFIHSCLKNNWYDKIVLFDDTTAKKIFEKIWCDGEFFNDVAYIRADTKNTQEFKDLRNTEILKKKLTICTCVAFNGLNFKNKNEKILVMTSLNDNTTACEIIQEAGRVRRSDVFLRVYYDGVDKKTDIDKQIDKANILNSAESLLGLPEGLLQYNHRLIDEKVSEALRNVQKYINENSSLETIQNTLVDAEYFIISNRDLSCDDLPSGNRMRLSLKKRESDMFIEDLMNDKMLESDYPDNTFNNYRLKWQTQIKKMIDNDVYEGITLDTFKRLYKNSEKKTLISTIIDNLQYVVHISLIDDTSWNKYVDNIDKIKKMIENNQVLLRDVASSFKHNVNIREKYKDKIEYKKNTVDLSKMIEDIIAFEAEKYEKTKKNRVNHIKQIEIDGIVYNTIVDAANILKKNKRTILRWLKENKAKYV